MTHVWFAHGIPCKLSLILGIPQKKLNSVIYFARYIITSVDEDQKLVATEQVEQKKDNKLKNLTVELDAELVELEGQYDSGIKELKKKWDNEGKGINEHKIKRSICEEGI